MQSRENGAGRSLVVGGMVVGVTALAGVAVWWWTQRGKSDAAEGVSTLTVAGTPILGSREMTQSAMYGPRARFQESGISNGAKEVHSVGKESSTKGAQMEYSFTVHDEDWEYGK